MNKIRYIYKYCIHFVTAFHTKGYGVHSPFLFHLIRNITRETEPYYIFRKIETLRHKLLCNRAYINITDCGTGFKRRERISYVAHQALKEPAQDQLLFRIIRYMQAEKILELGTSFGITTLHLASSSSKIQCYTIEECPSLSAIAQQNFDLIGLRNIKLINARIEDVLEQVFKEIGQQDFIYIDANHCKEALLEYFEFSLNYSDKKSVLVLDNIYRLREMEKAWRQIKAHPQVAATVDFFYMGLVFFYPNFKKKHYKVRF